VEPEEQDHFTRTMGPKRNWSEADWKSYWEQPWAVSRVMGSNADRQVMRGFV
jgi:hypothetical protein